MNVDKLCSAEHKKWFRQLDNINTINDSKSKIVFLIQVFMQKDILLIIYY